MKDVVCCEHCKKEIVSKSHLIAVSDFTLGTGSSFIPVAVHTWCFSSEYKKGIDKAKFINTRLFTFQAMVSHLSYILLFLYGINEDNLFFFILFLFIAFFVSFIRLYSWYLYEKRIYY